MSRNTPQDPAKRILLKSAAAIAAGTALAACTQSGSAQNASAPASAAKNEGTGGCTEHSAQSYSCYGKNQAGIVTPHQPFGTTSAFDIRL